MFRRILFGHAILLLIFTVRAESQTPLGTDFTYQGNLSAPGMPAVTTADLQFTLHEAVTGGAQIGVMLQKDNVALINGAFTLSLDFGAAAFSGDARWLQVAVRSPAGTGSFTTLTPRQPLTGTPHSTFSIQTRGLTVNEGGQVGVGITPNPNSNTKLQVNGSVSVKSGSGFFIRNAAGNGTAGGIVADINNNVSLFADSNELLHLDSDGRVGVGENHPFGKLHVRSEFSGAPALALEGPGTATLQFYPQGQGNILTSGDIGFPTNSNSTLFIRNFDPAARIAFTGNEGTRYPPSGMEDLRIVRGRVLGDGTIDGGSGFTVTRLAEGEYRIDYTIPFADDPAVTATINSAGFSACFVELRTNNTHLCAPEVIRRSDGNHVDGHFNFIAIGPR